MNNFGEFQEMIRNPKEYAMKKYGLSESDPNAVIQKLMSEGKITQEQYNMARSEALKLQNNPMFRQMMNR